jgi:predicted phage terminase large subunit-like protein
MNNPKEGSNEFEPAWKKFFEWKNRRILAVTPSEDVNYDVGDLDKIIFIDPAVNGEAGFLVTGMDKRKNVFILDAQKKVWSPPEMVDLIFTSVMKWNPRIVVIENVLFSVLFEHWIYSEMQKRGIRFRIESARTKQKEKAMRVRGLANYFSAGQIFFNITQTDLIEEYDTFGSGDDYHILDALAYGPEFWKIPVRKEAILSKEDAMKAVMKGRDAVTGYSSY